MRRLILFSLPTEEVKQAIMPLMFPKEFERKVYEIFPHYSEETQTTFEQYKQVAPHRVKPLRDNEYVLVEDFQRDAFAGMIGMFEGPMEADHNDIYR